MSSNKTNTIFEPSKPSVPANWDIVPFEKGAVVVSDKGKRIKQKSYLEIGSIPIIDQGQDYFGGYTNDVTMTFDGDLPVVLFGDHTRSIKYVDKRFAVGAEGIKILKPAKFYEPKFFYYLLRSLHIPSRGYSRHFQFLKKVFLPVAPANEQKRIVAGIEKQFSRLDKAVSALKRIKANLKRYKASVLKAAVEGKLTEEWRKENPGVKPASDLLKRILAERRRKWEEAELEKMRAKGKEPKDDKWKKKYKEPIVPDATYSPKLSKKWRWVTLDQIAETNPSIDKKSIPDDLLVSFVPMQEVGAENGYINVNGTRPFSEVKKGFTSFLEGDVLFAKITPCMENGKMTVVPPLSNGYGFGSTEFHVMRPYSGVNPYFIYYMVSNLSYRKEAAHSMTGAVGQKRVPASFLMSTVMPLPPFEEQLQIVSEVQQQLSIIEGIYAVIDGNLKRAERLRQSILKKSFSGRLVPQDSNDEPASVMLEMISKERTIDKPSKEIIEELKGEKIIMAKRTTEKMRPLIDVLVEEQNSLTPEELFLKSGHNENTVDDFYAELKAEMQQNRIEQIRPNNKDVFLKAIGI